MKKTIIIILIVAFVISLLLLLNSCDKKTVIIKTIDSRQSTTVNSGEESTELQESNKEDIKDSIPLEDEKAFEEIYNPPKGGSPENIGKIIFCSQSMETEDADYYLYTINPNSSNMTKLAFFGNWMWHPEWSPEYSRIAYSANLIGGNKIFIMTADGIQNKQITFGDGDDKFPTWSPDGKHIAYISYINGTPNLFIIDIYGNNKKQLTFVEGKDTVLWPSFSPVEDAIAYTYNSSKEGIGERIIVVRSDGTKIVELPPPENPKAHFGHPGWSPDGKILYFISNQSKYCEVWKIDYYKLIHNLTASDNDKYDDLGLMQLTHFNGNGSAVYRPRVSPDGKKLVFCGWTTDEQPSGGFNLITMNIDGTDIKNITGFTKDDCQWPDW